MNLFATDLDPITAAYDLCNKHIIKMPSETATMLGTAFSQFNAKGKQVAYYNHPSSIWVRESLKNFEWTLLHGLAQCEEYTRRYKRQHASQKFIDWAANNISALSFNSTEITPFARCFSEFKQELDQTEPNTIKAYKKFYWLDKQEFATWPDKKLIPFWWPEISDKFVDKSFINGVYSRR